ncbi:MAG: discoidin domain-containing protein [Bacteroidales bacterium]|jgi:hypothetical protein|nr:discoidin domain-containing protein [Bacteroidales bacterium]
MMRQIIVIFMLAGYFPIVSSQNIAWNKPVTVSSQEKSYPAKNLTDGQITRESCWMSAKEARPPHIIEVDLQKYYNIGAVVVHTGIPESELRADEKDKAAGFWSVKHLKLQYWDDANWTDISGTEVFENRQTVIRFDFATPITSFCLRLLSNDGESIRIMEMEIWGSLTPNMPLPPSLSPSVAAKSVPEGKRQASVTVTKRNAGTTLKYVGYNQGYYMPGGNASAWIAYSGVNSMRVWTSLNDYVPENAVENAENVKRVEDFDARKEKLRHSPENNPYIRWESILPAFSKPLESTNTMVFDYALEELQRLKIDVVLQIGSTDFNDTWANKWKQWQRYYAMAFYAGKKGGVEMFAMQNEPNHRHSGPMTIEQWTDGMKIVSDAVRCALEDVNKLYDKSLQAKFVGPVTAGSNNNWWAEIMKQIRTDYHGKKIDYDLIDIFSTHSYNLPAAGYLSKISDIRGIITANHPQHRELPVVFTEIGRWMNAYLIDREETMDSPSLFTEWAGIYANNMKNGGYGMWAFKFANTASSTYPRGIKSGHHLTWQKEKIVEGAFTNIAAGKPVKASEGVTPHLVTDGDKSDLSAWTCSSDREKWIEIDLGKKQTVGSAIIYTGSSYGLYTGPDRVRSLKLQYRKNNTWTDIEGTIQTKYLYVQAYLPFKEPVATDKIRFVSGDENVKVREIKLFGSASLSKQQNCYDISGIQRTGEVVRLFAKGFKNGRDLMETTCTADDADLDVCTSFDATDHIYYMWIVQRNLFTYHLDINISDLEIADGAPVTVEEVSPSCHGEVAYRHTYEGHNLKIAVPPQSVLLVSIPAIRLAKGIVETAADAVVKYGKNIGKNFGNQTTMAVELNSGTAEKNQVACLKFDLSGTDVHHVGKALIAINGNSSDTVPFKLHVYAVADRQWNEKEITWATAPNLSAHESQVIFDKNVSIAGQIVLNHRKEYHCLDVTNLVRRADKSITFLFVRELRQLGDDIDMDRKGILYARESESPPYLELWTPQ